MRLINDLRDQLYPKITELSNMCFRNQTLSDKMSQNVANIDGEVKKKFGDLLAVTKGLKTIEEQNERLGELVVSIEADLKRRIAD